MGVEGKTMFEKLTTPFFTKNKTKANQPLL